MYNQVTELNRDWDDNIYYTLGQELSKDLKGFFVSTMTIYYNIYYTKYIRHSIAVYLYYSTGTYYYIAGTYSNAFY